MGGLTLWTDVLGDWGDGVRGDTLRLTVTSSFSSPRASRASMQNDFLSVAPLLVLLLFVLLAGLSVSSVVVAAIVEIA